jgi:hypothetical protein
MASQNSELFELLLGSSLGAGVLVICKKAGLDPLNKQTALKAWSVLAGFAVVLVLGSHLITGSV